MKKFVITLGLLLPLTGCVTEQGWKVAYERERAAHLAAQEAQPTPPSQQPQPQPQQQATPQSGLIRDQSIASCEQFTDSKQAAFVCELFTLNSGTQLMGFTFPDGQTLSHHWQSITHNFAGPYCLTSNKLNIKAAVGQIVVKEDVVRMFSCQTAKWDDWKKADIQKYLNTGKQVY